ncbi:PLP-dependent aminotransferase family protein [Xanthomonas campestris pv. raphani]|uniref:aminotransferase-like domain-containing protein n=1 Tax=Xanthomonas TaxID=338 RepID=UPI00021AF23D|nr:PLP-dependent aminotransferase family protein [Xanthomonas campestris]AEL08582.1 transcriptional regulator [Xanthomonas campestris pv. raphani 756C]MCC5041952.1 PLP-dependent aminotransferase family protein [Xanthomonas campestris]MEA9673330.1 PLP-dependent aminotransferase family protein [Xanthomonas campestris pv. raphani]MEA9753501.1 PLP-dependent aminotransferase family protein [Xanthomonas campestris pv. raphani]MEA9773985.1 PLP-dependent aminotransferase family protein [Xanthomonas ca
MLLYESLATQLRHQIERGTLRAGERLPSIRQLAASHGISPATAVQACLQLEREGRVQARPRSGYFVRAAAAPLPAATPTPRRRAPGVIANPALQGVFDLLARTDLVPLHLATPAPALLPGAQLAAAISRQLRRQRTAALDYAPPQGHAALRRQIALRYAQCGTNVDADEVVITAGAMEAISLALRTITTPGDVVVVETPTYHGILQAVAALRLKVLEVPNRAGQGIDAAHLDALLQRTPARAAILVPNFNNPLGSLTPDHAKRAVVDSCARHGTVVIEDDIYGELAWSGQRPRPLRQFDTHANVITCGSFSKVLSPGLRVGWLLGGPWTDALVRAKYFSTVGNASLPQLALADYLAQHDLERHLRKLRRTLADNGQRLRDAIVRHWPSGTRIGEPAGGLSLWLQLPDGGSGQTLFEAALAKGIGTSPGQVYSSRGDYADHLRLTCGQPWSEALDRAMRQLGRLAAQRPR